MADLSMPIGQEPLVMGMTPSEYQAAFSYLDQANFAREIDGYEAQQQRYRDQTLKNPIPWTKRPEFWALILGALTFGHSLFVQWLWPILQKELPSKSPYVHEPGK
ncbi:hypothetical protein F5Y12DRAFT_709646 [Xylaria sp. FL1777]|nr:hypothetical protein F5Y12DRAFT_709646 [Xylaria sp. FL1777]